METLKVILFVSVVAFTLLAGAFCLIVGGYALFRLGAQGKTRVQLGSKFSIDTPFPALVLSFFGVVLFLSGGWLVNSKITIAQLQGTVSAKDSQLAQLQDTTNAGLQSDLAVVTSRLRLTQSDLKKARDEAEQIRSEDQREIAEVDAATKTELATKATTDDVKGVDGKVDDVRTDLTGTQDDLKMARSELGTLIARNHEDIEQLRRLGERDYIEFTIDAKNKPQKVGSFVVELRGTNPSEQRCDISLIVDDSHIEKKNLAVNEPIFFDQRNDRRPMELVVNTVAENKVTGYISVPKSPDSPEKPEAPQP